MTVSPGALPDFASSVKVMRTFSPAATRSRSGLASRGDIANTGIVQVPRDRPMFGQPDEETRPSKRTATHPVVVSGVGLRETRQIAPGAASTESGPSPFPDGAPKLGHVVFSTRGAGAGLLVGADSLVARISHATGRYQSRGVSCRICTSSPASLNEAASQAAESWFDGVPYIRVPNPTSRRTVSTIRCSDTVAASARSAARFGVACAALADSAACPAWALCPAAAV